MISTREYAGMVLGEKGSELNETMAIVARIVDITGEEDITVINNIAERRGKPVPEMKDSVKDFFATLFGGKA